MSSDPYGIGSIIKNEAMRIESAPDVSDVGRVVQVGDGIARVSGLSGVVSGELLRFENGSTGIAMNLEEDNVGVVMLGNPASVNEGDFIHRSGDVAKVPVGNALLGRVVDALGRPVDHKGPVLSYKYRPVERVAPGVLSRQKVTVPLLTGIKAIDTMVPVGRGQRQLIIGDRQTGKTSIAVDAIINQKGRDVYCIYVAIGQKTSTVSGIVNTLNKYEAMSYTTVITAGASDAAPLQYFAPFSGCAVGEEWMEEGKDVLIVYDDLSKHAVAYRSMSLLLRRPPGREAYPGDVFYLHSRLLERAGRLNEETGGGSITAFPIIETQSGNMAAYSPTNVISITDGQIYLEPEAFNSGIRPAINPGLSVSRVGGAAQVKAMRKISAPIRTELAQYRELASFSQFSSDLDKDTRRRLKHGERIVEILKQAQYEPAEPEEIILIFYAAANGFLDDVHVEEVSDFEHKMVQFFLHFHQDILNDIRVNDDLSESLEEKLKERVREFKDSWKRL